MTKSYMKDILIHMNLYYHKQKNIGLIGYLIQLLKKNLLKIGQIEIIVVMMLITFLKII